MKRFRKLFTKVHEIDGKRFEATTWDCTPPGHHDVYTLSQTDWKLLDKPDNQLELF